MELNGCEVHVVRSYSPSALAWPALALVVVIGGATEDTEVPSASDPAYSEDNGAVVVTVSVPPTVEADGTIGEAFTVVDVPTLIHRMLEDITIVLRDRNSLTGEEEPSSGALRAAELLERLTSKQRQILQRLMEGMAVREIAAELCISVATARSHIQGMFQRLQVTSQLAAVAMAYKAGWSNRWPVL